ncbi:MAG TPA: IS1182 family transposase [Fusobacterium sp.]|uniref:IS1182 family transposase n=1 Tax=Fusobacterium sp. TaxID=68766 RepID=UPI002F42199B
MNNQKVTYINYNMNQLCLPSDISNWVDENHISRIVNEVVENIDDKFLEKFYEGGGRSSYHPKMMLKIVIYAYTQGVTSGRKMAKMCKEHIPMILLTGRTTPDFRTINRFRSERLKYAIEDIFETLVIYLIENGYANTDIYYLDGTKIEANANKFSFVWTKSTLNYQEKLTDKLKSFLKEAVNIAEEENKESDLLDGMKDLSELSYGILKSLEEKDSKYKKAIIYSHEIDHISNKLTKIEEELELIGAENIRKRPIKKLKKKFDEDFSPRMKKYEINNTIANGRNSFSKTNHDATFMRMKNDYMKNGQLKPGYNVQIGTNNQFVLNYSIHSNPTDVRTFIPHIKEMIRRGIILPETIVADGGYGSEENYMYCKDNEYNALIPYNTMRLEEKRSYSKNIKHWKNWFYDEECDRFICPNDKNLEFKHYSRKTDKYGYTRDFKIYECENCSDCPYKKDCTKSKGNRQIHYNPVYEELKADVRDKLLHDENSMKIYAKRKIEPETVFGNMKANLSFKKFRLRGNDKVKIEFGLMAMAHNIIKMALVIAKNIADDTKGSTQKIGFTHSFLCA